MKRKKNPRVQFTVRMPSNVHREITKAAARAGLSLNAYMMLLARSYIEGTAAQRVCRGVPSSVLEKLPPDTLRGLLANAMREGQE